MTIRSRDFIAIADRIRGTELSLTSQIEYLGGRVSELSNKRDSLESEISALDAAIAAAYFADIDEDGYPVPDYSLIASLEYQQALLENELQNIEHELSFTVGELENKTEELQRLEEEKAQTLFEIQERARKTSTNISLASGMYGAYAGVGNALQDSLQTSLSSLAQAAGILGGSVSGSFVRSTGHISVASGISSQDIRVHDRDNISATNPLSAFTKRSNGNDSSFSANRFSTNQRESSTLVAAQNYHTKRDSSNNELSKNFVTKQDSNSYAFSSFGKPAASQIIFQNTAEYQSRQTSQYAEKHFVPTESFPTGLSSLCLESSQHSFPNCFCPENDTEHRHSINEEEFREISEPLTNDNENTADNASGMTRRGLKNQLGYCEKQKQKR